MIVIRAHELREDLEGFLAQVEKGQVLVATRDELPFQTPKSPRPFGLCAGEFELPDDFDAPLPDGIFGVEDVEPDNTSGQVRFFFDYGECFWGGEVCLSSSTSLALREFTSRYDQYYGGYPPNFDWSLEDCREFNRRLRDIKTLIWSELNGQVELVDKQPELPDNEETWNEWTRDPSSFITSIRRQRND